MDLQLLYANDFRTRRRRQGEARLHAHDCWQLECMLHGRCRLSGEARTHELQAGAIAIIPPGLAHGFRYDGSPVAWISCKFRCADPIAQAIEIRPTDRLQRAIVEAMCASFDPPRQSCLEQLIGALLQARAGHASPRREEPLIERVRELVSACGGRPLSVGQLARACDRSPNHLGSVFKAATGETLKRYIDGERWQVADRLLRDDDLPIGVIAEELGFVDLFSFSRFVKRSCGLAPRAWRQRHQYWR